MPRRAGWDPYAVVAASVGVVMVIVYLWLIGQQDDEPAPWFVVGLVASAILAAYAAVKVAPGRRLALAVAGCVLVVLGFLGIFSIGLPILVAGILALVGAARSRRAVHV